MRRRLVTLSGMTSKAEYLEFAGRGNILLVKSFVELHREEIDVSDTNGNTALHWAAFKGHADIVEYLLESGASFDIRNTAEGQSPFLWACINGDTRILHAFVTKAKGRVNLLLDDKDMRGYNSLQTVTMNGKLNAAFYLVQQYREAGGDVKSYLDATDKKGHTALAWSAFKGYHQITQLLTRFGADLDQQDVNGFGAIHWAAQKGHDEVIHTLLENGANLHLLDTQNRTPRELAAAKNHIAVTTALTNAEKFPKTR